MRASVRRFWSLTAAGLAIVGLAGLTSLDAAPRLADVPSGAESSTVDVELVLAVDISYSMDPEEQALQRDGYAQALVSPDFLNALRSGMHGKIAVTYFEWAGAADQRVVVPWRVIDNLASAQAFADEISRAPSRRAYRTSISGAIAFAGPLFDQSGQRGMRRVLDISGDGVNNQGMPVTIARDELLARGVTINGLPIMLKRPSAATMDIEELDIYYEDCVIGGPGSFVVAIREREQFKDATRTKLVLEVADRLPARGPARFASSNPSMVPASADQPRVSCTVGERLWQQRWGRDFN